MCERLGEVPAFSFHKCRMDEEKMREDEIDKLKQEIQEADMVLVGLGEEFDQIKMLNQISSYKEGRQILEESETAWMIPAWNRMYASEDKKLQSSLKKLADVLAEKNYFVISTATNDFIREIPWREGRLVMPCGGSVMKQCPHGCSQGLTEVTADDWKVMENFKQSYEDGNQSVAGCEIDLGCCPECGAPLILNNIYTEKYDENGYLDQWAVYTKWLQGTLNRKLLILELGVGLQCPSVIRWPFEKVAFYNQKAVFYRVNEKLYQLSEELSTKGTAIAKNAIDCLEYL